MYKYHTGPSEIENIADLFNRKRADIQEKRNREKQVLLEHKLKCLKERKERLQAQLRRVDVPENPLVGFQVVHGFRVESRPGESIAVVFSPVAKVGKRATVKGPFEVVLKRSGSEDIRLHSYILPIPGDKDLAPGERQLAEDPNAAKGSNPQAAYLEHKRRKRKKKGLDVISIEALAAEHLSRDGKVDVFAQAVSALLNAYTRRMCQVTDLIEGFGEEIEQVETSRSLDRIGFLLRLQAGEDEEGNDLVFQITLRYDLDKIRPKHKSLDVQFVRATGQEDIDDETKATFLEQCQELYCHDLVDAIRAGFYSE